VRKRPNNRCARGERKGQITERGGEIMGLIIEIGGERNRPDNRNRGEKYARDEK
jgi:hypothetical protein